MSKQQAWPQLQFPTEETVRGIVIGPMTYHYEFFTEDDPPNWIAKGDFENDEQAIAWFRENYPEHFKRGAEMRCYD